MARCQPWALGTTSASANRRISLADRLEGLVEAGVADHAFPGFPDQSGEGGAVFPCVARGDQRFDGLVAKLRDLLGSEAEVGGAHDFALIHRDGAEDLIEILSEPDARQQLLSLAESAVLLHTVSVGRHFLDCFDIGRKPGQPVDGMLFSFDLAGAQLAVFAHPIAHGVDRATHEALGGEMGLAGKVVERQQAWLLQWAPLLRRSMRRHFRRCNASPRRAGREFGLARVALAAASGQNGADAGRVERG